MSKSRNPRYPKAPKLHPLTVMVFPVAGGAPKFVDLPDPREQFIALLNRDSAKTGIAAKLLPSDRRAIVKRRKGVRHG